MRVGYKSQQRTVNSKHYYTPEQEKLVRAEIKSLRQENQRLRQSLAARDRTITQLTQENKQLRKEIQELRAENQKLKEQVASLKTEVEELKLQIEELRRMVFGGSSGKKQEKEKKKKEDGQDSSPKKTRKKARREKASYRRPIPHEEAVTHTSVHDTSRCPDCGELLEKKKTFTQYVEDIAQLSTLSKLITRVERHIITSGYCPQCKKRHCSRPPTSQDCTLGPNIRLLITYLTVILRLSYEQVRHTLRDMIGITVSDGEIARILEEQSQALKPERDEILNRIRGQPGVHYDETTWKVAGGELGNYAWVASGVSSSEVVYLLGQSRGKGVGEALRGDNRGVHVGISDDYAAYRTMFEEHQLCWAHPHRKLRELAESKALNGVALENCCTTYKAYKQLYRELEYFLSTVPYDKDVWDLQRKAMKERLLELAQPCEGDTKKLQNIKKSLRERVDDYLTCLKIPGIPCDNNKAERMLRHLVLKRKSSHGSKSQKGANMMAILYSVLLSKWLAHNDGSFFVVYEQLLVA